jgi:hypothetical protein
VKAAYLLFIFCSSSFALAPHPLYFTGDGRSTKERITVDGQEYVIGWDGASLSLEYGRPKIGGSGHNGNGGKKYHDDDDQGGGLGCTIFIALVFWPIVIFYLLHYWGIF